MMTQSATAIFHDQCSMPAQRTSHVSVRNNINKLTAVTMIKSPYFKQTEDLNENFLISKPPASEVTSFYPMTLEARNVFRTNTGKRLTPHQWAVYDFVLRIPRGKVMTYKDVSLGVGGSPRSVGNALRNNPFSPHVPCHRVIASNLFVGGFFGEWGKGDKTGTRYNQKVSILCQEGIHFDNKGYLKASDQALLKPGILVDSSVN